VAVAPRATHRRLRFGAARPSVAPLGADSQDLAAHCLAIVTGALRDLSATALRFLFSSKPDPFYLIFFVLPSGGKMFLSLRSLFE